MIAALDRLVTVMIEVPIDTLQLACRFVFGSQRIINGQENRQRGIFDPCFEVVQDESDQFQRVRSARTENFMEKKLANDNFAC